MYLFHLFYQDDHLIMSYILEALRKSEKDRKREEVPTLQEISAPRQTAHTRRTGSSSRLLQAMFALVLLLVLVLGGILARDWIFPGPEKQDPLLKKSYVLSGDSAHKNDLKNPPSTKRPQEKLSGNLIKTGSHTKKQLSKGSADLTHPLTGKPAPPLKNDDMLVFNRRDANSVLPKNLPLSIQDDLRNMQFAGHAYSLDRTLRLIMIDNKILHEGDPVNADLRLFKITENGVILLYRTKRIRINLFTGHSRP